MSIKRFSCYAENVDTVVAAMESGGSVFTIQILLELDPIPTVDAVIGAVDKCCSRYPILKCHLQKGFMRDRWIEDEHFFATDMVREVSVETTEDSSLLDHFYAISHDRVDLEKETPLQVLYLRKASTGLLVLRLHHAITDGNGGLQFASLFGDLLQGKEVDSLPELLNRGFGQLFSSFSLKQYPALLWETVKENLRPMLIPLVKPLVKSVGERTTATPSIATIELTGETFVPIKAKAKEFGLTINEYLLCAMFRTSEDLREQYGRPTGLTGALFTIDLRRYLKGDAIGLSNFSGGGTALTKSVGIGTFAETAEVVREVSKKMKSNYPGIGFIWFGMVSELLRLPAASNRAVTSLWLSVMRQMLKGALVFSNVGATDAFVESYGEALQKVSFVGPFPRFPLPWCWVSGFQDSLTIHCNQICDSKESAALFTVMYQRLQYNLTMWPFEGE